MQIVSEKEVWGEYLFSTIPITLLFLFFLFLLIGGILMLFEDFSVNDLTGTVIIFVLCGITGLFSYIGWFIAEPTTQYKAIVNDFNVVYEKGYEVVGQEGDLYILEKE